MKQNLVVSDQAQITLPADMRKSPGLGQSAMLTAEQLGAKIVLTPAVVRETERYTDGPIDEWDRADAFKQGERRHLSSRLTRRRG